MSSANLDLDVFKDIPGYKGILKAVLKYQIQLLVEQLSEHGGEESVLLSANISEGTLSHLGTVAGKGFLIENTDVKRQYLSYCLKRQTEKRKSEFMSPTCSQEESHPVKVIRTVQESVGFPVHKKPYFRMQRRNTRMRSGSKQFSSAFSKGVLRSASQKLGGKVVPSGGYLVRQGNESYQGQILGIRGQRPDDAGNLSFEGQRSDEQSESQRPLVVVKTEVETEDSAVNEENRSTPIESEVTVKVEPPDIDESGDREPRAITEDIQTLGDGLGHQYSPMESEESFSEGSQSFDFLDDETFFKKYSEQRRAQKYTPEDVMKAIQAVREGTNRFRAGKLFGIPRSTMFRLVDKNGRIKNDSFCFMTPTAQVHSDQSHSMVGIPDQHVASKDDMYSRGQHILSLGLNQFEDTPSPSNGSNSLLPTLSPEFSKISPDIMHSDQIPTVVKGSQSS